MAIVIGICGGSGSGKTTLSSQIRKIYGNRVTYVSYDSYCMDHSHLSVEERETVNYDCPDCYDGELLVEQVKELKMGHCIEQPIYDFKTHTRKKQTSHISPSEIILVEGILIFQVEKLQPLLDIKIFVDADKDIRLARRMLRDIKERGREISSVVQQYLSTVRPMHELYIEPWKKTADIVFENNFNQGLDQKQVQEICQRIDALLK